MIVWKQLHTMLTRGRNAFRLNMNRVKTLFVCVWKKLKYKALIFLWKRQNFKDVAPRSLLWSLQKMKKMRERNFWSQIVFLVKEEKEFLFLIGQLENTSESSCMWSSSHQETSCYDVSLLKLGPSLHAMLATSASDAWRKRFFARKFPRFAHVTAHLITACCLQVQQCGSPCAQL